MKFINVLLPLPTDKLYTYQIPPSLENDILPGQIVLVPLKKNIVTGLVFNYVDPDSIDPSIKYEFVYDILDLTIFYDEKRRQMLKWMAEYYMTPLGEVFSTTLTPGLFIKSKSKVSLIHDNIDPLLEKLTPNQKKIVIHLKKMGGKPVGISTLRKTTGIPNILYYLRKLEQMNFLQFHFSLSKKKPKEKVSIYFKLNAKNSDFQKIKNKIRINAHQQLMVIQKLIENNNEPLPQKYFTHVLNISPSVLKKLQEKEILVQLFEKFKISKNYKIKENLKKIVLNEEQKKVVYAIQKYVQEPVFFAGLIWGVTGSGKTQIYIEVARNLLEKNKSVLVLAPEISLTPQTISRFEYYLNREVLVYHSKMSEEERYTIWKRVAVEDSVVVIGVRSAIFLPFKNLGGIFIDEEHESSYKNSDSMPTYNARDIALYLAKIYQCLYIGGSATPSLESIFLTQNNKIQLFELHARANKQLLPRIKIIDRKEEFQRSLQNTPISERLLTEIQARLLTKEQVLIFKNLRGYSPYLRCLDCNHIFKCPECDITLTYHKNSNALRCHYCGYQTAVPPICPRCKGYNIQKMGEGTEKLEEYLKETFSTARIVRLDRDTVSTKNKMVKRIQELREGKADILIGTKMITKGLDFEKMTLVGIVDADMDFVFPDFRAQERGFQTLIQVIGRSGRGERRGDAILQTYDPDNPIFELLKKQDYHSFVEKEMNYRRELNFPPFSRMILFEAISKDRQKAKDLVAKIGRIIQNQKEHSLLKLMGPVAAPREKLKSKYRFHLICLANREYDKQFFQFKRKLRSILFSGKLIEQKSVQLKIDVDPLDLL